MSEVVILIRKSHCYMEIQRNTDSVCAEKLITNLLFFVITLFYEMYHKSLIGCEHYEFCCIFN